jgi:hypothetical protein
VGALRHGLTTVATRTIGRELPCSPRWQSLIGR